MFLWKFTREQSIHWGLAKKYAKMSNSLRLQNWFTDCVENTFDWFAQKIMCRKKLMWSA